MADNVPRKKGFFRRMVNVKQWINFDEIVFHSRNVVRAYKALYTPGSGAERPENFDEAVKRLGLNDEALKQKKKFFLFYSITYVTFSLGLFIYSLYLITVSASFFAIGLSLILAILMLSYAIREHFWYMQIAKRRLGCTLKEWVAFILRRTQT